MVSEAYSPAVCASASNQEDGVRCHTPCWLSSRFTASCRGRVAMYCSAADGFGCPHASGRLAPNAQRSSGNSPPFFGRPDFFLGPARMDEPRCLAPLGPAVAAVRYACAGEWGRGCLSGGWWTRVVASGVAGSVVVRCRRRSRGQRALSGSVQVTGWRTLEQDRRHGDATAQHRDGLSRIRDHRSLRDSGLSTRMRA